jgi:hypothetical protein
MPVEQYIWLKDMKGLFPEPGKTGEQNEAETVTIGQQRSFHPSIKDNEL